MTTSVQQLINWRDRGAAFAWSLGLAAVVLVVLFLYLTSTGLSTTSDSFHYLAAARNWRSTGQLLGPDGSPYRYWGPLYPLLLSVFYTPTAIRWLHGAALLGNLLLWSSLGRWLLPPGRAALLPLGLALSTAMLVPARFVWSETVFALLLAAYCYGLLAWCRTDKVGWLGLATVAGFLLPLQRTAGFMLLAGAGLGLLVVGKYKGNWGRLVAHWVACAAGGLAWHHHTELLGGSIIYRGLGSWSKLAGSLADYGFVLLRWLVPLAASWRADGLVWYAVALPGLLAVLWPRSTFPLMPDADAKLGLRLLWLVVVVYILGLLVAVNMTRGAAGLHDAERYVSVLSGPLLLLTLARWPRVQNIRLSVIEGVLVLAWLGYLAARVGHNLK